jgi:hypothetical protein
LRLLEAPELMLLARRGELLELALGSSRLKGS